MFHFSIRDVLWLTVVVALDAGWWMDHTRLARDFDLLERYSGRWQWQLMLNGDEPYRGPPPERFTWGP